MDLINRILAIFLNGSIYGKNIEMNYSNGNGEYEKIISNSGFSESI